MITTKSRRLGLVAVAGALGAAVLTAPFAGAATSASPIPSDLPRAGCFTLADAKGDSTEAGSDIKSLVMRSTASSIIGYIQMYQLGTSGDGLLDMGNHFAWGFTLNGHEVYAQADQSGAISGLVRSILSQDDVTARVDGADSPDLKPTAIFDFKTNQVIISIDRAAVEKATGGKLPSGTILHGLNAEAGPMLLVGLDQSDDQVNDSATLPHAFAMDHNPCFGVAPATVFVNGDTTVGSHTVAHLAAQIVNADNSYTAGRTIRFMVGNQVADGKTDANGEARANMNIPFNVGFYTLTVYFAGDDQANETTSTTQFVVAYRKTHMTMSYNDRPDGRLFTVRLLDSTNQPVTGQTINWSVKGASKPSSTTNGSGYAQFLDTSLSREVMAKYDGVTDQISGCSAEFKY